MYKSSHLADHSTIYVFQYAYSYSDIILFITIFLAWKMTDDFVLYVIPEWIIASAAPLPVSLHGGSTSHQRCSKTEAEQNSQPENDPRIHVYRPHGPQQYPVWGITRYLCNDCTRCEPESPEGDQQGEGWRDVCEGTRRMWWL